MKKILSAIVPAVGGCNLKCLGCFIDQKDEANEVTMTNDDYVRFFSTTMSDPSVVMFSLQGHEALLPSVWPLSRQLLQISYEMNKPTNVVTNGVFLKQFAHELVRITDTVTVSVDSHDPVLHDMTRQKHGAWSDTIAGIRSVREQFKDDDEGSEGFREYLNVSSILYPNKLNRLAGMPKLLASLGVTRWAIAPLINLKKGGYSSDNNKVVKDIITLGTMAKDYGVKTYLVDELRTLPEDSNLYEKLSVENLDKEDLVMRLSPNSGLSVGKEILDRKTKRYWDKKEDPRTLVDRAEREYLEG